MAHLFAVVIAWTAVVGAGVLVLGQRRLGITLVMPAVFRWVLWPLAVAVVEVAVAQSSFWEVVLAMPIVALFIIFAIIRVVQTWIAAVYGEHVAVRVSGAALISTLRTLLRVCALILFWPVRAFRRRQSMDDILRDWRRL